MSIHLSTVLSYNTWNVTNISIYSVKIFSLASLVDKTTIFSHYINILYVCTTSLHAINSVQYRVGSSLLSCAVCIFRKKYYVLCISSNVVITYLTVQKSYCIFMICLLFTPPGPLLSSRKTVFDFRSRHIGKVGMKRGSRFPPHNNIIDLC